jgi:hypothetical protein
MGYLQQSPRIFKGDEEGFRVLKTESVKNPPKHHFRVTRKDLNLFFHLHFLNLIINYFV